MEYRVVKYNSREWAIYAKQSNCFVLFGTKKVMTERCAELNKLESEN